MAPGFIGENFMSISKWSISVFKNIDKKTNYRMGNIIRTLTNTNTRGFWNKKLSSYGGRWRDFTYKYILEFLPENFSFSLLDIGCALGDGCVLLKSHFPEADISGADFSEAGIEKAKKKSDEISFFILDISKEDPPGKYDYITLIHTLEHFNNPYPIVDKCLKFVDRALIIQVPYVEQFDSPYLYSRCTHRYLFNEKTFSGYNCKILKITEYINIAGYRYIIYGLSP